MSKCSTCLGPISKCGHTETLAYMMSDGSEGGCWACEGAPDDATPDPEFAEKIADAERPVLPVPPLINPNLMLCPAARRNRGVGRNEND